MRASAYAAHGMRGCRQDSKLQPNRRRARMAVCPEWGSVQYGRAFLQAPQARQAPRDTASAAQRNAPCMSTTQSCTGSGTRCWCRPAAPAPPWASRLKHRSRPRLPPPPSSGTRPATWRRCTHHGAQAGQGRLVTQWLAQRRHCQNVLPEQRGPRLNSRCHGTRCTCATRYGLCWSLSNCHGTQCSTYRPLTCAGPPN